MNVTDKPALYQRGIAALCRVMPLIAVFVVAAPTAIVVWSMLDALLGLHYNHLSIIVLIALIAAFTLLGLILTEAFFWFVGFVLFGAAALGWYGWRDMLWASWFYAP